MKESSIVFEHWFWVTFFIAFGVFILSRRSLGSVRGGACGIRISSGDNACERIEAAVERRQQAEGPPPRPALWMGSMSVVLGIAAAFLWNQQALLYAFLCLWMSVVSAVTFLRLRNAQPKRVAVLAARKPESVIPAFWFAVTAITAVSLLAFLSDSSYGIAGAFICCSSALSGLVAWRLTQLPAMLSGVDVPAEQAVDDQLRFTRSSASMVYALVQTYVFVTQVMAGIAHPTTLQIAVYWWNWFPWIAFGLWMFFRMRRPRTLAAA